MSIETYSRYHSAIKKAINAQVVWYNIYYCGIMCVQMSRARDISVTFWTISRTGTGYHFNGHCPQFYIVVIHLTWTAWSVLWSVSSWMLLICQCFVIPQIGRLGLRPLQSVVESLQLVLGAWSDVAVIVSHKQRESGVIIFKWMQCSFVEFLL